MRRSRRRGLGPWPFLTALAAVAILGVVVFRIVDVPILGSGNVEAGTPVAEGPRFTFPLLGSQDTPTPPPPTVLPTPVPSPTPVPPTWLQALRETALWSSADADATLFTTIPAETALRRLQGPTNGRYLVDFPGDGLGRQPGHAWAAEADLAAGTPPPWIASSEVPDVGGVPAQPGTPIRLSVAIPPSVSAQQIAVVDDRTGLLLYGVQAHVPQAPASTTKIATAIVAIEHEPNLERPIRISIDGAARAARDESSIMGLVPGTTLSLHTLLYGLLLPSGNDAAEQLTRSLADSRDTYLGWMNDLAARLGLQHTRFLNPSGLDQEGHQSSAYDLAQLTRHAMSNATFRAIVASPTYTSDGLVMANRNPLLGVYPGIDGVKTGTTDMAGRAIVASATRDGNRVNVVVLHSEDLVADSSALFDWTWKTFRWSALPAASPSPVASATPPPQP